MDDEKEIVNPLQPTGNNVDPNRQNTGYASQNSGYNPQNNGYVPNNFNVNLIIASLSGWMKFMGIFTIISGSLTCIGVITAAIGVPLILAGIALVKGSASLKNYSEYPNPFTLNEVFTFLNKYFKTQGIISIVFIILTVIYIVILMFIAALSFNGIFDNF